MLKISSFIRQDREFSASMAAMAEEYRKETSLPIAVNGLSGGAGDAYLAEAVAEAYSLSRAPVILFVNGDEERERVISVLRAVGINALGYRVRELLFHNISASCDIDRERLSVLFAIIRGECQCVVTTPAAALGITIPKARLAESAIYLSPGAEISPEELCTRLESLGFSYSDSVEAKGQFSRRGGIVDLWGADMDMPVRAEFFGDEIDRLVYFDGITQRAEAVCEGVELLPAREVLVDSAARGRICSEIERMLGNRQLSEEMRDKLSRELSLARAGLPLAFRDKYLGLIYEEGESLLSYFTDKKRVIFTLGTADCRENARGRVEKIASEVEGMLSYGGVTKRAAVYIQPISAFDKFTEDNLTVHINPFAGGVGNMKLSSLFGFRCRSVVSYGGNLRMLLEDIRSLSKGMYRTVILCENKQGRDSLLDTLTEEGIGAITATDSFDISAVPCGEVCVGVGEAVGFDLITPKIAVLSMAQDRGREIMRNKRRQRILRRVGGAGQRIMNYAELTVGDYVVHASYGIGLFEGIQTVTVDGVTKDYITIKYAGTDKLLVPCDRLEVIGKYIGERDGDGSVKLSRMGGTEWGRAKAKAKAAARDIAEKLIALYAERQRTPGFAFPTQSELEDSFDADFEHAETEAQLTAIEEIKKDMIRPVPMNRLLCGDVGFGKTEVALRAAFKAILGGKQVAILVPTTILALQHYQTALSRMRGYAVNIEMISRFKKPKERADILHRTAKGQVDILIGTHSIIAKNVEFKDLGLLIIDEEQRFGVAQKERLRELRKNVDTLMLSATPIPRTLNMAMSGISDISVLDEAPGERRPVETYVLEHDDGIIHDAIRRELDRHGQVLYLYNKIDSIDLVAGRIAEAIPEARVAYAHGRMEKEELEDIWQELVRGEIDVLVCTTIIETGVDLPGANTLIIENADCFGLSQLHQIRGRVGRSERQAYAYLTFRPGKALSEVAEKRLSTIREFAEFGAGFKIALRDMEIRGVGNLLGTEQHGYIESVGYSMYVKLLNEAVLEAKGEKADEKFESTVRISLSAHIPEYYIGNPSVRMEMYKKISHVETPSDGDEIIDEFLDRFGEVPREVERLVDVAVTKAMAERARIPKVEYAQGRLSFVPEHPRLDIWAEVFEKFRGLSFAGVGSPVVTYRVARGEEPARVARNILVSYVTAMENATRVTP